MNLINLLLYLPKHLLLSHYVVWVNLTQSDPVQIEVRCAGAHQWLFGRGRQP